MRISAMVNTGQAIGSIEEEMARCTPLCRRCHMAEDGRLSRLADRNRAGRPPRPPRPCVECGRLTKNRGRGLCHTCYMRWLRSIKRTPCCNNCGLNHAPNDKASCIEGHGDDPPNGDTQVTIHGKYGRDPMPVEFRDALVEMVRLVNEAIDRGELPKRDAASAPTPAAREANDGNTNL